MWSQTADCVAMNATPKQCNESHIQESRKALAINYTNIDVFDGVILSCRQFYSTAPTSASHELFSNMTTGTLTMGSLTSNIINNSTTTNNSEHNFSYVG